MGRSPLRAMGRSPLRAMGRSPLRAMGRSHLSPMGRSPLSPMGRSPIRAMGRSPLRAMGRSPLRAMGRSPLSPMGRSPLSPMGRSPLRAMGRSPLRAMGRSPLRAMGRSPLRAMGRSHLSPMGRSPLSPMGRSPLSPAPWILLVLVSLWIHGARGVWPLPQSYSSSPQRVPLHPRALHFIHGAQSAAKDGCSVLDQAFRRYSRIIFPEYDEAHGGSRTPLDETPFTLEISVERNDCDGFPAQDSSERYNLSVAAGGGSLVADSVWGALRGLETFSQIVFEDASGARFVNKSIIQDFPRFSYRGILLDSSRHYLPLKIILKTLDAMSYNKLNVFHWHLVDDPSFPFQSRTFPNLSTQGAFDPQTHIYSLQDVHTVVSHARLRGIRVVPEFDSPGHTSSWGKGQPGLLTPCYSGSVANGQLGPVNPSVDSSFRFMSSLISEVSTVFPDAFIHLGGDEVDPSCWKSNPDVQIFMKKMGFGSDFRKLESFYMERLVNLSLAVNKTPVVWQEVFDLHQKRSFLSVVEVWKHPCYLCEVRRVTKEGLRVILAAPWYLDLPGPTHHWAPFYTVRPLDFEGSEEQKRLLIGGEVCLWGEYVDAANLAPRLWPRASAAAERLWSDEDQTNSLHRAFPRLQRFRCELLRRGVQAEPLFVGHCPHEYPGV